MVWGKDRTKRKARISSSRTSINLLGSYKTPLPPGSRFPGLQHSLTVLRLKKPISVFVDDTRFKQVVGWRPWPSITSALEISVARVVKGRKNWWQAHGQSKRMLPCRVPKDTHAPFKTLPFIKGYWCPCFNSSFCIHIKKSLLLIKDVMDNLTSSPQSS